MEETPLEYYARQGPITDPREESVHFEGLPSEVDKLLDLVQRLVIHTFWTSKYGITVPEERNQELQLRFVSDKLRQIRKLESSPLTQARAPERRLLGNCRDFSVLLCSMLRHHHIPARARCGFATYFVPNHFEDHWVCEYWGNDRRWIMVDAQLDALQREQLGIDFDALDVPADRFIVGGNAWQMCRLGKADSDDFGINNLHGLWFVRGNLIRDLASLNKVELLPWDAWGLIDKVEGPISDSDMSLLDKVATLSRGDNDLFTDVRSLYLGNNLLQVPPVIRSYRQSGFEEVNLGERFSSKSKGIISRV